MLQSFSNQGELLAWVGNAQGTRVEIDGGASGEVESIQSFQILGELHVAFLLNIIEPDGEAHASKAAEMMEDENA